MHSEKILLGHGSGGKLMHELIDDLLIKKLKNPILNRLTDSAVIRYKDFDFAFTTDSFVVDPLFFPGGDIGKLAVCGSINDLVMQGARPEYLSLGLIIEEGMKIKDLERIIDSVYQAAKSSKMNIVTGDLKVVEKNSCDKIFINSSGIGRVVAKKNLSVKNISCQDKIIVTGNIAVHGIAIMTERKGLDLGFSFKSDCAALDSLLLPIIKDSDDVKFLRDPTRGGLATTLNEIVKSGTYGIVIREKDLPLSEKVRAASELLGIDPLYIANEGIAVLITDKKAADNILRRLKKHPLGRNARIIGEVVKKPKEQVVLETVLGTQRLVDMLTSQPLPRIC